MSPSIILVTSAISRPVLVAVGGGFVGNGCEVAVGGIDVAVGDGTVAVGSSVRVGSGVRVDSGVRDGSRVKDGLGVHVGPAVAGGRGIVCNRTTEVAEGGAAFLADDVAED